MKQALVFGGTGYVGSELIKSLASYNIKTVFTYYNSNEKAVLLEQETGFKAYKIDLSDFDNIKPFIEKLSKDEFKPDIFIHAACRGKQLDISEVDIHEWRKTQAINCESAFFACREISPFMKTKGCGDIVFLGALDRVQSIKIPPAFAATQGMLSSMTMAMAKELGEFNIRVNMIVSGILDGGLSNSFNAELKDDFLNFSALKRKGTAKEIAEFVTYFVLNNSYVNGKTLPVNGGI